MSATHPTDIEMQANSTVFHQATANSAIFLQSIQLETWVFLKWTIHYQSSRLVPQGQGQDPKDKRGTLKSARYDFLLVFCSHHRCRCNCFWVISRQSQQSTFPNKQQRKTGFPCILESTLIFPLNSRPWKYLKTGQALESLEFHSTGPWKSLNSPPGQTERSPTSLKVELSEDTVLRLYNARKPFNGRCSTLDPAPRPSS